MKLQGYTRRIARAVAEAMAPRWDDYDPDVVDDVLEEVEQTLDSMPPLLRQGLILGLYGLEFGAPIMMVGVLPTSWVELEVRERRFDRINHHRILLFRRLLLAYKVLIGLPSYSHPRVETFLGADRRALQRARRIFRERLMAADAARESLPDTPLALGSAGVADPSRYLDEVPT